MPVSPNPNFSRSLLHSLSLSLSLYCFAKQNTIPYVSLFVTCVRYVSAKKKKKRTHTHTQQQNPNNNNSTTIHRGGLEKRKTGTFCHSAIAWCFFSIFITMLNILFYVSAPVCSPFFLQACHVRGDYTNPTKKGQEEKRSDIPGRGAAGVGWGRRGTALKISSLLSPLFRFLVLTRRFVIFFLYILLTPHIIMIAGFFFFFFWVGPFSPTMACNRLSQSPCHPQKTKPPTRPHQIPRYSFLPPETPSLPRQQSVSFHRVLRVFVATAAAHTRQATYSVGAMCDCVLLSFFDPPPPPTHRLFVNASCLLLCPCQKQLQSLWNRRLCCIWESRVFRVFFLKTCLKKEKKAPGKHSFSSCATVFLPFTHHAFPFPSPPF